jgi:hypothetical protein
MPTTTEAIPTTLVFVLQSVFSRCQGEKQQPTSCDLSVAADCAADHDEYGLEKFLRFWAERKSLSYRNYTTKKEVYTPRWVLFTGSRVYGCPKPTSDFDLVWYLEENDLDQFRSFCTHDSSNGKVEELTYFVGPDDEYAIQTSGYGSRGLDAALRFDCVNVIAVSSWAQSDSWKEGTYNLVQTYHARKVNGWDPCCSREDAVEEFQAQFRRRRLHRRGTSGEQY